jgi:hypothetical protein
MKVVRYVSALLLVALAGCGGGGGGESEELSIRAVTPSTVTATFSNKTSYEGGDPREVALTASFSGETTGAIFVLIEDPDAVFQGAELQIDSESSATLRLTVDDSAAVGVYEKPMVLHVCRDAACASEFDGSPRTIQKHITIEGTTLSTSALSFASTVGIAATSQTVAVTAPSGTDFNYETDPYVNHTGPDGSTNLLSISEVFSITKTSSGLVVRPTGVWAGQFVGRLYVTTPGYAKVAVDLDYQVGTAATPVVTPLTSSVNGSGQAGSTDDIPVYVEYVHVMERDTNGESFIAVNAMAGSPDPGSTFWLRYYDQTSFTHGTGPAGNADRLRFFLNPCFFGTDCLAPGTYTANIEVSVSAFGEQSTVTVPVTFTVNP